MHSFLENPAISAVTSAKDEAGQQEASALYAALMAAARVSKTLISIDVASPAKDSSELVQALSKQVVAYCLRNMVSSAPPLGAENTLMIF